MNDLVYRPVTEDDFAQLKCLHEEFFPVRYSDNFYKDVCAGRGLNGGQLFTRLAVSQDGTIEGFILSQVIHDGECEDREMFAGWQPKDVCYILTLGTTPRYRRTGVASYLVDMVVSHARLQRNCGGVYLHVIHYNHAAIRFYQRNGFLMLRTLEDFYRIDGIPYTAFLYILYVNGCKAPLATRIAMRIREMAQFATRVMSICLFATLHRLIAQPVAALLSGIGCVAEGAQVLTYWNPETIASSSGSSRCNYLLSDDSSDQATTDLPTVSGRVVPQDITTSTGATTNNVIVSDKNNTLLNSATAKTDITSNSHDSSGNRNPGIKKGRNSHPTTATFSAAAAVAATASALRNDTQRWMNDKNTHKNNWNRRNNNLNNSSSSSGGSNSASSQNNHSVVEITDNMAQLVWNDERRSHDTNPSSSNSSNNSTNSNVRDDFITPPTS